MLDLVRNLVSSFIGKILLAVMILSFALWGVGDILSSGNSQLAAKIGNEKITLNEFYYEFQNLVRNYNQANSSNVSPKEAYENNFHNLLLNELVFSKMINNYSKNENLLINDESLKKVILDLPQFQNQNGVFSKNKYKNYIFNNFETEDAFLKQIESTIYKGLIFEVYDIKNFMNDKIVDLIYQHEGEKIKIGYFLINKDQLDININQNLLKKHYDENKNDYLIPESVIIDYIEINLQDFKDLSLIKNEQALNYYESNVEIYTKAEERDVQIFRFKSKTESHDFYNNTKNLNQIDFNDYILSNEINSNTIEQFTGETFTKDITDKVFKLELNKISETIEYNDIGFFNFKIKNIIPAKIQSYDEVSNAIFDYLALEAAYAEYDEAVNSVDEMLINDYSFKEILENTSNAKSIVSVNSDQFEKILEDEVNFNGPVGYISDIIVKNNVAYIYKIIKKNEAHIPEFDKVKDKIKADFEIEEKNKMASMKAGQILIENQFKELDDFENFTKNKNYSLSTIEVSRANDKFLKDTTKKIFNLQENNVLKIHFSNGNIGVGIILDKISADNTISNNFYSSIKNSINLSFNETIESIIGNEIIKNSEYEIYYNNIDQLFM